MNDNFKPNKFWNHLECGERYQQQSVLSRVFPRQVCCPKLSTKATNESREKVWFLMLRGHFRQSIIRILRTTETIVYKDIKFLNEKSREFVFDMAKGIHTLIYQHSIEGINETLAECRSIYYDNKNKNNTNLSQKVAISFTG